MKKSSCTKWYHQKEQVVALVVGIVLFVICIATIVTFRVLEDKRVKEEEQKKLQSTAIVLCLDEASAL